MDIKAGVEVGQLGSLSLHGLSRPLASPTDTKLLWRKEKTDWQSSLHFVQPTSFHEDIFNN